MKSHLRILQLEDNRSDCDLVEAMLIAEGFTLEVVRVESREQFQAALESGRFDLIISDYSLPSYDGLAALALAREQRPTAPFIFFSGTIGEEVAIESLQKGATDYVLKDRPERLVAAVRRALQESEERALRKEAEENLRKREKWFRALIENASDVTAIVDLEAKFIYGSPSAERLLGYDPKSLLGQDVFPLLHPEDRPAVRESFARCVDNPGLTVFSRFRIKHQDGSWRDFETLSKNLQQDPEIGGVVINARDVTERRAAEEALRQSEERFRQIAENVSDLIAVLDLQGRRLYNSPSYRSFLTDWRQLEGPKSFQEIHPSDRRRFLSWLQDTVRTGFGRRAEFRLVDRAGAVHHVESQANLVHDQAGQAVNTVVVSRDITERKKAEDQIQEQAALLDKARDAICVTDMEQRIIYWNQSAENLYGWSAEEALTKNANDLLFKHDTSRQSAEALKNLIRRKEWLGELRQTTKLGREVVVESRWTLVTDSQRRPKSILVINTDITEKRNLEKQFLRAQRLENLGMLASGIAHDLNNVLAPVLMAVSMLREQPSETLRLKMLDTLEKSAQRGAGLVKQILSFARGVDEEQKPLQLKHLVADLERIIRETFPKAIQFRKKVPAELWTVLANPTQIHQILLNLCVNSRDAMPDGGTLSLVLENVVLDEKTSRQHTGAKSGTFVRVQVRDTGIGMPREVVAKAFDPFFTTKPAGQGTGLGLFTVLGIVKTHGGFIEMESEPGQGTLFSVYLPASMASESKSPEAEGAPLPAGNGEKILLVDDEAAIREIMKLTLENFGYTVEIANDGVEAVAVYNRCHQEIKLVITDMEMPFMNGPALMRALEKINPQVKFIVASGLTENFRLAKESTRRPVEVLPKPYSTRQLLTLVHELLQAGG